MSRTRKDWCTWWPDGNWGHCCKRHDDAYDKQIPFFTANWRLRKCVRRKAGVMVSSVMFLGTTLFGLIPYLKSAIVLKRSQLLRK